jgi:hypothetical protein
MIQDILNIFKSLWQFIVIGRPVVGILFVLGLVFLAYVLYHGLTADINNNPDHWSHKDDVHNWTPNQD